MTRIETLQAVFAEREKEEHNMLFRNPWVSLFYNWVVAVSVIALMASFVKWGLDIRRENREEAIRNDAVAEYVQKQEEAAAATAAPEDPYAEAFEAVAGVIARLNTDQQKKTELGVFIARYKSPEFANDFKALAEQEMQWPLYNGTDKTYDETDLKLVDEILRPFLDKGKVPDGLKDNFCWAKWSPNDLVARNVYEPNAMMETWRWQG
jgi:hypothetical protein